MWSLTLLVKAAALLSSRSLALECDNVGQTWGFSLNWRCCEFNPVFCLRQLSHNSLKKKFKMRFQHLLHIILIVCTGFLLISGQKPGKKWKRKLQRHNCLQRRCMPLHSRVPFPWGPVKTQRTYSTCYCLTISDLQVEVKTHKSISKNSDWKNMSSWLASTYSLKTWTESLCSEWKQGRKSEAWLWRNVGENCKIILPS